MSIRLRLTLWLTALLAVVLVGLSVFVYTVVADQMSNRLDTTLQERSEDIQPEIGRARGYGPDKQSGYGDAKGPPGKKTSAPMDDEHCRTEEARLVNVDLPGESLFVEMHDDCGNVDVRSSNLTDPLPIPPAKLASVLGGTDSTFSLETSKGELRVRGSGNTYDNTALFVATPLASLRSDLFNLRIALIGIVLGTVALTAGIGWFLAAKAMEPVDRMTRRAHEIGETADISLRLPEPRQHDEIGRLATTFNEMLERIQRAFTTQRQFLSDASHELRTPLTVIRANIERLRRDSGIAPDEREETLRLVEREVDRMGRLVEDLLGLARADEGDHLVLRRLSLDSLLLEVYNQQRSLAGRVRLELGEFEPMEVDGDPDRLKQVLLNLIENGLRHTSPGGSVTLDLKRDASDAVVSVRDSGSGIAPEHLPHIFERFYRADASRTRRAGGTGLGLAIAREIAIAHGGSIEVASEIGTGTTFTVRLPLAPAIPARVSSDVATSQTLGTLTSPSPSP